MITEILALKVIFICIVITMTSLFIAVTLEYHRIEPLDDVFGVIAIIALMVLVIFMVIRGGQAIWAME